MTKPARGIAERLRNDSASKMVMTEGGGRNLNMKPEDLLDSLA